LAIGARSGVISLWLVRMGEPMRRWRGRSITVGEEEDGNGMGGFFGVDLLELVHKFHVSPS
jgi:hypothetical protein